MEATFENVVFLLEKYGWLAAIEPEIRGDDGTVISKAYYVFGSVAEIGSKYAVMLAALPHLAKINFSNLKEPRLKYMEQEFILQNRINKMAAGAFYYDLDLGTVMRYPEGKFTAKHRDTEAIATLVEDLISENNHKHTRRFFDIDAPAKINWEEPARNKAAFLQRGNYPSMNQNPEAVGKRLNREKNIIISSLFLLE